MIAEITPAKEWNISEQTKYYLFLNLHLTKGLLLLNCHLNIKNDVNKFFLKRFNFLKCIYILFKI